MTHKGYLKITPIERDGLPYLEIKSWCELWTADGTTQLGTHETLAEIDASRTTLIRGEIAEQERILFDLCGCARVERIDNRLED